MRCCDGEKITKKDVENLLNWHAHASSNDVEIQWKPARVILQDFTGVPCVVDLAAMRDVTKRLGGDPTKINPGVPVDLVIDHSVQVDKFRSKDALEQNLELEMKRNKERFVFLKWGAKAFDRLTIVPPGAGIVHQVNLEYLARVVFKNEQGVLYPDSLVGTDSHTPMVNGLGVYVFPFLSLFFSSSSSSSSLFLFVLFFFSFSFTSFLLFLFFLSFLPSLLLVFLSSSLPL